MTPVDIVGPLFERRRLLEAQSSAVPGFAQRLQELRAWQANRLALTYQDLRQDPLLSQAIEFFLSDLYGQDFARRNLELARAWRYFKRALPAAALKMLQQAIELETLTVELDQAMLPYLAAGPIDRAGYAAAYRALGRSDERKRQIDLLISIGAELRRIVRRPWIGLALRAAHVPAHAAGVGVLQDFLERGFAAFRPLRESELLLRAIRVRETQLMQALLSGSKDGFDVN